jgi:hypothetical protein
LAERAGKPPSYTSVLASPFVSKITLALAAMVVACGGQPMAPYSPVEKNTDLSPRTLYAAAEGTLLDQGYLIARRDPERLRLETQKRTLLGSEIRKDKFEYVWIVETAGGTLRIRLECQRTSGAQSEDCGDERPERLVKQQNQLVDLILAEARGD